jgi:hypothetical protein
MVGDREMATVIISLRSRAVSTAARRPPAKGGKATTLMRGGSSTRPMKWTEGGSVPKGVGPLLFPPLHLLTRPLCNASQILSHQPWERAR